MYRKRALCLDLTSLLFHLHDTQFTHGTTKFAHFSLPPAIVLIVITDMGRISDTMLAVFGQQSRSMHSAYDDDDTKVNAKRDCLKCKVTRMVSLAGLGCILVYGTLHPKVHYRHWKLATYRAAGFSCAFGKLH